MGNFAFSNLISAVRLNGLGESFLPPMILNMTITGSIVILFVLLARLILKKAPKIFSYALWAVVLFRLLCPVSVTTDFSLLGLFDTPATENTQYTTAVEYVPYDVVHTPDLEVHLPVPPVINNAVNDALPQEHAALGADPLEGEFAIGSLVWLLGIGAMAIYSAVSYILLRRRLVGSVLLRNNIFLADGIGSPFVMGFIRPKIYLPSALSEQEQGYIILHEEHHIRRGDHIIKAMAFIALCIHWFNPLVWVAFFLSSKDMEMSCDEAVLKKLGEGIRADYSASLLSLATGRRIIAGTPLAFGEGDTKSRIKNMLNWKKPKTWMLLVALVACVVAIVFCATNPRNDAAEDDSMVVWELDHEYPDAVVDIVDDYIMQQVEYYNSLGSGENAIGGEYTILEAKVVGLTKLLAGTVAENHSIEFYRLEYRLLPSEPSHVVLAGGMQMEEDWITEWGSTGQPHLAILCDSSAGEEVWSKIGVTNTDVIDHEYNTAEMLEQYHDKYVAAAMELYKAYVNNGSQNQYGTAFDVSGYLELAADTEFQNMNLDWQTSLLVEYEDLLDDYTLIARESKDGTTAFIVGQYNGNPLESPLHGMYSIDMYTGEEEYFRFLYREDEVETVEAVVAANKTEFPPSAGYRIEDSVISWTENSGVILIQPKENALLLDVPWNRYFYTPNGREYIVDAVSRGIDVCGRTDTFLYFYLISERFGEIAERIALTEAEAQAILAEERVSITDGFGFSASLHIDGQTTYYNEREGVPQSVLDMAVEQCNYQFAAPSDIASDIVEATLDMADLDSTLRADKADLPRLKEILKNAEFGYMGSCGYGAKLTLTLSNGETLVLFKGTDGCDTIVFGSYGGYFLGEKENIEFWEMFGLDPDTKERIEANPNGRELLYKDEEILISVPAQYAHLVKMDGLYSDDQYTNKANFYYTPEYFEHEAYTASRNGGWMLTVSTTLSSFAEASLDGYTSTYWTKDETQVYVEQRPTGNYNCSNANLAEFKAVMDSIQVDYIGLEPFTETVPEQAIIPVTHSQTALDTATNAVTTYLNSQFRNNPNTYRTEILYLEPDLVESTSAAVRYFQRTDDLAVANPAQAAQMIAVKAVYFQDWFLDTDSNQADAGLQAKYFYMLPNEVVPYHWYIHDRKNTSAPSDIVSPVDSSSATSYLTIEPKRLGSSKEDAIAQLDAQGEPRSRSLAGTELFSMYIRSGDAPELYFVTKDGRVGELPLPYADETLRRAQAQNPYLDTNYDVLCYDAEVENSVRNPETGSILSAAGTYRFIVDLESFTCAEIFTRTQEFTAEEVNFSGQVLTTAQDEMTREERLSWVQAGPDYQQTHFTSLGQYAEGDGCIAYLGQWVGTPHMNQYRLDIRFSDGTTAYLPLPDDGGWGAVPPDTMVFQNGKFIYEISFPTTEVTNEGNTLIHLQGTYHYEVDLTTKTVSLTVLQ